MEGGRRNEEWGAELLAEQGRLSAPLRDIYEDSII